MAMSGCLAVAVFALLLRLGVTAEDCPLDDASSLLQVSSSLATGREARAPAIAQSSPAATGELRNNATQQKVVKAKIMSVLELGLKHGSGAGFNIFEWMFRQWWIDVEHYCRLNREDFEVAAVNARHNFALNATLKEQLAHLHEFMGNWSGGEPYLQDAWKDRVSSDIIQSWINWEASGYNPDTLRDAFDKWVHDMQWHWQYVEQQKEWNMTKNHDKKAWAVWEADGKKKQKMYADQQAAAQKKYMAAQAAAAKKYTASLTAPAKLLF